jgi:hypothetical protein
VPAADLYVSTLFAGRRRFVERTCDRWFVLSALHGLVPPERVLEPYDVTLKTMPTSRRRTWAAGVLEQVAAELGDLAELTFEIHAGATYRDFGLVEGLRRAGGIVEIPAAGLRQGEQLAFYLRESP